MKFFGLLLVALAQLVPFALGGGVFYIYEGNTMFMDFTTNQAWSFYRGPDLPTCDYAAKVDVYRSGSDVSANKWGVACDGGSCPGRWLPGDSSNIDRLEINTSFGHYTWYKNRDHHIVDLNDKVVGKCEPISRDEGKVDCRTGLASFITQWTFFKCESDIIEVPVVQA
ncbi:hypothetical protein OQA88_5378 [Cercophora sp. LCS_1]